MIRVALETATDQLSVAVQIEGTDEVLTERVIGARRHASDLLPVLDALLDRAGSRPSDIGLVALADGPGSFTGLRVGAAVARVLADAGARLVTASTLLVRAAPHGPGRVLAMVPALRGEIYAGVWDLGPEVRCLFAPRALEVDDLEQLPGADLLVGDGPAPVLDALTARGLQHTGRGFPEAADLLRLVDLPGGVTVVDPLDRWDPDYGRPAEAQARWERAHGRRLPVGDPDRTA